MGDRVTDMICRLFDTALPSSCSSSAAPPMPNSGDRPTENDRSFVAASGYAMCPSCVSLEPILWGCEYEQKFVCMWNEPRPLWSLHGIATGQIDGYL